MLIRFFVPLLFRFVANTISVGSQRTRPSMESPVLRRRKQETRFSLVETEESLHRFSLIPAPTRTIKDSVASFFKTVGVPLTKGLKVVSSLDTSFEGQNLGVSAATTNTWPPISASSESGSSSKKSPDAENTRRKTAMYRSIRQFTGPMPATWS